MNNAKISLKKFLQNKNTITVLCVLLGIVVLYIGYNYRIKKATDPYPIPYALNTLSPGTQITSNDVGTTNVPRAMLKGTVIADASSVIGKYVSGDTIIPKGSLFYTRTVVTKDQLPGVQSYDYTEGYVLVNMSVDINTSYGNLIYPGNYIDIYLKAVNKIDEENMTSTTQDKIMVGKLIENVKVLAVLDSNGNNVFADLENKGTPSMIIFAVPSEYHILLRKAMYLRTYEVALIPVPTKTDVTADLQPTISSTDLRDFINKITVWTDDGTDGTLTIPTE